MGKDLKIIRLSHTLRSGDSRFPGNPDVVIRQCHAFEKGDSCNTYEVRFFNHNGTHIDFPNHYVSDGKALNDYDAKEFFFEKTWLLNQPFEKGQAIEPHHLEFHSELLSKCDALLIKTGFQEQRATPDFSHGPYLTLESAKLLRERFQNVRCIGLDTISLTSMAAFDEGQEVHRILLKGANAPFVIEDMDMKLLSSDLQIERMIVAPWFIDRIDGGPCTVFAEIEDDK